MQRPHKEPPVTVVSFAPTEAPRSPSAPELRVVTVRGDLDLATVEPVRARLEHALDARPDQLVVDLSGCGFIDATALGMLLEAHRCCVRRGARLTLAGCTPRVERLLSLTGLRGVFELAPAAQLVT